ncbi:MAG: Hpt domain-containing protein [Christensenellaceae bacterium]|jgi:HPt (histidine-containing phosphotransfer) domain-containing protein
MDAQEMAKYINKEEGLSRVRGNEKLYGKMLQMFLNSKEFDALDESLKTDDLTRSAEIAHGIKGMTGNLSLTLLFETSTQLMNELRSGKKDEATVAAYQDAYGKTRELVEALLSEIG